jgi:general secretion pathway protein D
VTLNAINQTLPQILDRIAKQVDIRWTMENGVLSVMPDEPYLKTYHIDYFNLSRNMKSSVNIVNSVTGSASSGSSGNTSNTSIESENPNQFWKKLEANLKEMLDVKESAASTAQAASSQTKATVKNGPDKATATQASAPSKIEPLAETLPLSPSLSPAASRETEPNLVIANAETGTITVRASSKNHLKVAEFLAGIQASAQRQVLIEATIVEVVLSDQYQAGVDWSQIANGAGWSFGQSLVGTNLASAPLSLISYKSSNFNATVQMLEQFGKTRVLSSPKIIALNNQTAVMKVVEEQVYFTLELTEDKNSDGVITNRTYTSTLHTVPVGLVMQVTPQVAESGTVTMNIRPTITNISSYVDDPAVAIIAATSKIGVKSQVPVLQVREFDSTLKIVSGQVAVLGGLIQDKQSNNRQGVPGLSRIPWVGDAFSYRDDKVSKIELVVFLRPIVVKEKTQESMGGFELPGDQFFNPSRDQDLSAFQSGLIPLPSQAGARQ